MIDNSLFETIEKAKKNDQQSFKKLFDFYWSYLFYFLLRRVKNEEVAEDLALKTFSKAFDKIHLYNSNFEFKTWLTSISKNIQIDEFRKENSSKNILYSFNEETPTTKEIIDSDPSPEDVLIISQSMSELSEKIKNLKPKYKTIIQLRYFEELSYIEISKQLNLPINTVKVSLMRAKKILADKN